VASIDELIWRINDLTRRHDVTELTDELIASLDPSAAPVLARHLATYVEDGNARGRDILAEVLTGVAGVDALPDLIRASARDLRDDQAVLQGLIIDLVQLFPVLAAIRLEALSRDRSVAVREVAVWAWGFIG
jgi:hypothetical protein